MNIQNLSQEEIKDLYKLLGKMIIEPVVEKDPLEVMIDEIMEEFDFGRVLTTMEALDWKWASAKGGRGIPDMDELRATAERLLRDVAKARLHQYRDEYWEMPIICGTGGFEAKAWCDEDISKITGLDLAFIVSHWDTEIEINNKFTLGY